MIHWVEVITLIFELVQTLVRIKLNSTMQDLIS